MNDLMKRVKPTTSLTDRIRKIQEERRKAMKINRPTWLSKAAIMDHIKGAEMVSLSRESDFAKIPAELQLHIISYMEYPSVLELKQTCKYFNYFINSDVMRESREYQIEAFKHQERRGKLPADRYPCYTCLHVKPGIEFVNNSMTTSTYAPNYRTTPPIVALNNPDRRCIQCNFLGGHYEPGQKRQVRGEEWLICGSCGYLARERPITQGYYYNGTLAMCRPCKETYQFMKDKGASVRLLQFIIGIVIMPLACTGQAMPWTSDADKDSLRWIFTVTLDMLTIGGCFASLCNRLQHNYGGYSHKRTDNQKFVPLVEWTAFACWVGILISIFTQAHSWHFTGRYDRFMKGLTALTLFEVLLFFLTALWSTSRTRHWVLFKARPRPQDYV